MGMFVKYHQVASRTLEGPGTLLTIVAVQRENFVSFMTVLRAMVALPLNDYLLSGPDLTNNLTGVLLRFRQEKIAFTADIKSMFLQVQVDPKDWDALRFLWWPNDDLSREPSDYQMLVHLFGAKSSPACASFALRKATDDNETHASPVTVLTVKRNFYVDDCLKSVKGVKEAIQLIKELSMLLKTGGFHLTKYLSNCREVLSAIDHEDLDPRVKTLYLDNFFDDLPV